MNPATENKIVVITRKTRLDDLIARFNTEDQAKFYIEHLGADFSDYVNEDRHYKQSAHVAIDLLSRLGRVHTVDRSFVPNFIFGPRDIVVAIGQDGLVANVLKYLDGQLLIGVNPDEQRWGGVLLPFTVRDLPSIIPEVFARKRRIRTITMAQARLNTGESLYAVNDLFIGPRSHTSARYTLSANGASENQSSSGIIVSTGLGSTGWFRSIVAGAAGIATGMSGTAVSAPGAFAWDSDYLFFSVREPWPSKTSGASITFGKVTDAQPLRIQSAMSESGVIFSDGIESDYLHFNSGTVATIGVADKKGLLVE